MGILCGSGQGVSSCLATASLWARLEADRTVLLPSSWITMEAPGWTWGPLRTACRSSFTFQGVTGWGYVSLVANTWFNAKKMKWLPAPPRPNPWMWMNGGYHGDPDLVGPDVHVRADDGACRKVHSFSHHVLTEQSLLLLQDLGTERREFIKQAGIVLRTIKPNNYSIAMFIYCLFGSCIFIFIVWHYSFLYYYIFVFVVYLLFNCFLFFYPCLLQIWFMICLHGWGLHISCMGFHISPPSILIIIFYININDLLCKTIKQNR